VGETYGGRYEVLGLAGSGGMAEVYRARDELLSRDVALKVLNERLSTDRSFVERFRREAQTAANLNHPNIVSLFDYGADDGKYFIVMEYIDGRPLSDIIRNEGPLMPERAAEIASEVGKGLARAHDAGLVHRDIKPGNIMITSTGQTKVTDFGIARALTADQTMTQTGMVIGTAAYLSPEQAQGAPVDARSDVYSLGCVLYEMLTGAPPFTGDTPLSIAYKHVRENPERPSLVNSDVPNSLDSIVLKAMSKHPDNRYPSAREMSEDLDRYLAGQRVTATPFLAEATAVEPSVDGGTQVMEQTATLRRRPPPPPTRRRAGWYVLVALLVLGLLGLGAYLVAQKLFPQEVTVPELVGKQVGQAQDLLDKRGLESDVKRRADDAPPGQVFRQDPDQGASVEEGATVTLFVSSGPGTATVPDLTNKTTEDARRALEEVGLAVGTPTQQASEEIEEGLIISQSPAAGEEVETGTEVSFVVSTGPEATPTVTVPDVAGQDEATATATLENAGLSAQSTTQASDEAEGTVIAQNPSAGTEVAEGTTVTITVSSGPEETTMPDVTGQDADAAQQQLEAVGLTVTQQEAAAQCPGGPNIVCEQDPAPGEPVTEGDAATLTVNPRP
jgi:eukaryotic-like serine/threonine-protein kinase